jgi:hypothetical protein
LAAAHLVQARRQHAVGILAERCQALKAALDALDHPRLLHLRLLAGPDSADELINARPDHADLAAHLDEHLVARCARGTDRRHVDSSEKNKQREKRYYSLSGCSRYLLSSTTTIRDLWWLLVRYSTRRDRLGEPGVAAQQQRASEAAMNSTFGMSSAEADSTAMERIMQLKRIQRRTGTMPLTPMGNDDWAGWKPEGPMSGTLDGPLTPSAKAPLSGPSPGPKQRASVGSVVEAGGPDAVGGILKALKDTVRFLRSASTEHGEFVDAQSYHAGGADLAAAMQDLLEELQALKSRDASSATVLRMAKENLEQRKEQIVKLQTELANRSQADGMQSAQMADVLKEKDLQLQDAQERERASQELIRQLEVAVRRLQADLDSRRQQDANMHELIREAETQRELHQQEMDALRDENQRLLSQKAAEMDKVLQEAAREVEDVRAAMRRQQATDAKMPTPPASAPRSVPQSGGGADTLEVERLKEALADASTDIQEREEELGAAQSQILELQQLLKQQSDVLAEVRQREEELARERGFLANEAGESSASAMQALQEQVARQKVTIATLQKQMEGFGDTETELLKCREVIAEMERHKQEVDGLLDEVQEDRSHRDAVIAELKKLRTSVQQKDSLIAELNEQLHSPNVRQVRIASSFPALTWPKIPRLIPTARFGEG